MKARLTASCQYGEGMFENLSPNLCKRMTELYHKSCKMLSNFSMELDDALKNSIPVLRSFRSGPADANVSVTEENRSRAF